jgi:putative PEP-CTERM system TPR-repeat lipoprotein
MAAQEVGTAIEDFKRAVELTPLNPDARYQLAVANLAIGNGRAAAEELATVIQLKADYWPAQLKLAELMATSGDQNVLAEARERLTRVIARLPGDAGAVTALSIVEWKLGQREQAQRRLEQALTTLPNQLDWVATLAKMRMAAGNPAGAEASLRAAAEGSAKATIFLAEYYSAMGRFAEAEAELKRVLGREPQNATALLDLATLQAGQNRMPEAARTYRALAALPDRRHHEMYGLFLLQSGEFEPAIEELEQRLREDPSDHVLRTGLVTAYLGAAREPDAEQLLRSAVRQKNPDFDALFQKAVLDLGKGRVDAAQAGILSALQLRPEAAQAHYVLAAVHLRRGRILSSVDELGQALQRNPQFLPARIELARYQIAAKAPDVALEALAQAPASPGTSPAVTAARGWALLAMGDGERRRSEFESAGRRGATPTLQVEEALSLLEQRDAAAASRIAEGLLSANPGDMRALLLLARSGQVEGGPEAAIDHIRRRAESQPHSMEAWRFLGELLLAAGRIPMAVVALETAIVAGSHTPALEAALARAELRDGKAAIAESRLIPVVRADPGNDSMRLLLGAAQQTRGEYDVAAESYRKVLENNPSSVPALYNLAFVLAEHGKPEEALHLAEKARELAPESAAVDDLFGWVLYRRGLDSLAAIHLTEAELAGCVRASYHLAMARLHQGDRAAAQKALEEGLRRSPDLPEAAVVRKALDGPAGSNASTAPMPDPVASGWLDLGASDNTAARLEAYQEARGCEPPPAALDAVLSARDAKNFTARVVLPLMLCDPRPALANAVATPEALSVGNAGTDWKNPESMLQGQFRLSGVSAAGWDNTYVSWDTDRKGLPPVIETSPLDASDSSSRSPLDPPDATGWSVYDSLWPRAFH